METDGGAAREALALYLSNPAAAREMAAEVDRNCLARQDWIGAAEAERVLGLAAGHLSDAATAERWLSSSIRLARRGGDRDLEATARADLAYTLGRQGRTAAAVRQLGLARKALVGTESPRLDLREAQILKQMGQWRQSLAAYHRAIPSVRRSADPSLLAVVLGNRGVVQLYTGDLLGAERDLREADALFVSSKQDFQRAIILHNLGYVAALRGDVPKALQRYDLAERAYLRHREVPLELWRDRCELLLAAGLSDEAVTAARHAVGAASERGEVGELAEARLRLAQAAVSSGDAELAADMATQAAEAFARQGRRSWSALARWTAVLASMSGQSARVTATQVRRAATGLEQAGWTAAAIEARLRAASLAIEEGRPDLARRDLGPAASRSRSGPIWYRQQSYRARAMLHLLDGNPSAARRVAAQGLTIADQYRVSLGATDLRAVVAERVGVLARIGLQTALDTRRARLVLSWAERTRAAHLLRPPVRPPDDPALADHLGELRSVMALRRLAVQDNTPVPAELLQRQVTLERAVRDRMRWMEGADARERTVIVTAAELGEVLGERSLVEFINMDGSLHAVTVTNHDVRLVELGNVAPVAAQLINVSFALRRLIGSSRPAAKVAAMALARRCAEILDAALIEPLLPWIKEREIVFIPTAPLQAVPWGLLPSCQARAFSIAPSATLWRTAALGVPQPGHQVFVAGPDLRHADAEVADSGRLYPEAHVLTGASASTAEVLRLSAGADLLHVAAHGRFRADNPMFSSLELGDGPLTVYDIQTLDRRPDRVILSACQSGRNAVLPGDELMGMAAALITLGVRSLVYSAVDVDDSATGSLMVELHHRLVDRTPTARALADIRTAVDDDSDSAAFAAAVTFTCFGSM